MKYYASVSWGKDSLAMLLKLIEEEWPLDEVIFYDTGMEFQAIYNIRNVVVPMLKAKGIGFTELYPEEPFLYNMFKKPKKNGECGYNWCGGPCRWGTELKTTALDKYSRGHHIYMGVALDEIARLQKEYGPKKSLPLVQWKMTESDCLSYCKKRGYNWLEPTEATESGHIELYDILDRVSCWCCRNKNLKELKNIYYYLPEYWERLKDLQRKISDPMKGVGKSVFELETRFANEGVQYSLFAKQFSNERPFDPRQPV